LAGADATGVLKHVQRAHQVHGGVEREVLHRRLHPGLRGQAHHDLGPMPFEQRDEALRPDVHAEEGELIPLAAPR
jgi:hypothetical protein